MRALAISNGVESLPADEELTTNLFVEWLFEALEINANIPDFTIDTAEKVVLDAFWESVQSTTVQMVFPLVTKSQKTELCQVVQAVGTLFETTIKRQRVFAFWYRISHFLEDLQAKCTNEIFMVLSAKISVQLLSKYVKVENFERNKDIMKSMECCLRCGSVLADAVKRLRTEFKCRGMYIESLTCVEEFLDRLQDPHIYFSHKVFYEFSYNILDKGTYYIDALIRTKYLELISRQLEDRRAAKGIFDYCEKSGSIQRFEKQTRKDFTNFTDDHRMMVFKVLKQLLKCSRDNKLQMNCNWVKIFGHTLYTGDASVQTVSLDLFRLEAERTSDNEEADEYTLLDKAINAFRLRTDDTHAKDFINMFKSDVDFVECTKLFHLLRKYAAQEDPGSCVVIILIIDAALKKLAASKDPRKDNWHANLTETVFRHIECVKEHPQLLHRLIDTIDLSTAENNQIFRERFSQLEEPVLKAFYECRQYGTAIGLLEILKRIGVDDNKLSEMFQNLVTHHMTQTPENGHREVLIRMLAANDIFGLFEKINPADKHVVYTYLKDQFVFPANGRPNEITALYVALSVNILTAYNSTPSHPNMTPEAIQNEVGVFQNYLNERVFRGEPKEIDLSDIMLNFAFLDLHATFPYQVNAKVVDSIFHDLSVLSEEYRQTFKIYEFPCAKDLTLIKKLWRSVNNFCVSVERCAVYPSKLIAWYTDADVHLIDCYERFIVTILRLRDADYELYELFTDTVCNCFTFLDAADIEPLAKKLFQLIRKPNVAFDVSTIAMQLFLNLNHLPKGIKKTKSIRNVQLYLYQHESEAHNRERMLQTVDEKIERSVGVVSAELKTFVEKLRKAKISELNPEPRHPEMRLSVDPPNDHPHGDDSLGTSSSNNSTRRSRSLVSIDLSMDAF